MRLASVIATIVMVLLLGFPVVANAQTVSSSVYGETVSTVSAPDISAGIPQVTTQQAEAKAYRVFNAIYGLVLNVAPGFTLICLIVAALLSIFFREARRAIVIICAVLILIVWGPELVGWFVHILQS